MELLRRPGVHHVDLLELIGPPEVVAGESGPADERIASQLGPALEVRARYTGYIERAQEEIERARHNEHTPLPADLDYRALAGLSNEVRQKLTEIRPATLGQAARVPGVTPVAVGILLVHLKKRRASA
jgi:tRNA uridine 5-carboxymethylaminomethyl modification enzyme